MDEIAIRVEHLGKRYQIGERVRYKTLRESMSGLARRFTSSAEASKKSSTADFWALDDVSFEIRRGEVMGIIGRNGAGKSTLLKILSRITEPTRGRIEITGRIGSLLEVGTGFHPELTGEENIYLNGAILGMQRREIDAKYDEIVAFAEIEKFLDTPVKRYSSGMYMRLAFAVAAHLEPEILIVDEVLAVGDAEFQAKCLGKMGDVARQGRTVLFVSHQLNAIQTLSTRAMRLDGGKVVDSGDPRAVITRYLAVEHARFEWRLLPDERATSRFVNPYFTPTRFAIVDAQDNKLEFPMAGGSEVRILIEGEIETEHSALTVGFAVYAMSGELLFWSYSTDTPREQWADFKPGKNVIVGIIPPHFLNEGEYRVELMSSLHFLRWLCEPGINSPSIALVIKGGLSESPFWMEPRPGLLAPVLRFEQHS